MSRQRNVICYLLVLSLLGCSVKAPAPIESKSQVSRLVGKKISVLWGHRVGMLPSTLFQVRDVDPSTGTLCLTALNQNPDVAKAIDGIFAFGGEGLAINHTVLYEKDRTFWVHPSSFVFFTTITDQQANELAEKQNKQFSESNKPSNEPQLNEPETR